MIPSETALIPTALHPKNTGASPVDLGAEVPDEFAQVWSQLSRSEGEKLFGDMHEAELDGKDPEAEVANEAENPAQVEQSLQPQQIDELESEVAATLSGMAPDLTGVVKPKESLTVLGQSKAVGDGQSKIHAKSRPIPVTQNAQVQGGASSNAGTELAERKVGFQNSAKFEVTTASGTPNQMAGPVTGSAGKQPEAGRGVGRISFDPLLGDGRLTRPRGQPVFRPTGPTQLESLAKVPAQEMGLGVDGHEQLEARFDGEGTGVLALSFPTASSAALPAATAPTAASVAQQLATALPQAQKQVTEVTLNPEELGRVRISLTTTEAGMTVSIVSERPETSDLMRRHIDVLAQEFAELGYENLTFMFDNPHGESGKQPAHGNPKFIAPQDDMPAADVEPLINRSAPLQGGLDLKL